MKKTAGLKVLYLMACAVGAVAISACDNPLIGLKRLFAPNWTGQIYPHHDLIAAYTFGIFESLADCSVAAHAEATRNGLKEGDWEFKCGEKCIKKANGTHSCERYIADGQLDTDMMQINRSKTQPLIPTTAYIAHLTMRHSSSHLTVGLPYQFDATRVVNLIVYSGNDMMRYDEIENNLNEQHIKRTHIIRYDKGISYVVDPIAETYEICPSWPFDYPQDWVQSLHRSGVEIKEMLVPIDIVGQSATRYKVEGSIFSGSYWVSPQNIVLKTDIAEGYGERAPRQMRSEVTSLELRQPDKSVFEIPSGYTKIETLDKGALDALYESAFKK